MPSDESISVFRQGYWMFQRPVHVRTLKAEDIPEETEDSRSQGQNKVFAQMYGPETETETETEKEPEPPSKSRSANAYLQSLKDLNEGKPCSQTSSDG
jgi:hypothetical protein